MTQERFCTDAIQHDRQHRPSGSLLRIASDVIARQTVLRHGLIIRLPSHRIAQIRLRPFCFPVYCGNGVWMFAQQYEFVIQ